MLAQKSNTEVTPGPDTEPSKSEQSELLPDDNLTSISEIKEQDQTTTNAEPSPLSTVTILQDKSSSETATVALSECNAGAVIASLNEEEKDANKDGVATEEKSSVSPEECSSAWIRSLDMFMAALQVMIINLVEEPNGLTSTNGGPSENKDTQETEQKKDEQVGRGQKEEEQEKVEELNVSRQSPPAGALEAVVEVAGILKDSYENMNKTSLAQDKLLRKYEAQIEKFGTIILKLLEQNEVLSKEVEQLKRVRRRFKQRPFTSTLAQVDEVQERCGTCAGLVKTAVHDQIAEGT
ncbi:hypothetical protein BGZ83_003994 [Gryganskiella cystojenkinii]|nr:hypothetical protein BGZ83_003994 [Gryganskiella cystojenkinii]